jgi:hypothetical protein
MSKEECNKEANCKGFTVGSRGLGAYKANNKESGKATDEANHHEK